VICSEKGAVIVLNVPPDEMFSVRGDIDLTIQLIDFFTAQLFCRCSLNPQVVSDQKMPTLRRLGIDACTSMIIVWTIQKIDS